MLLISSAAKTRSKKNWYVLDFINRNRSRVCVCLWLKHDFILFPYHNFLPTHLRCTALLILWVLELKLISVPRLYLSLLLIKGRLLKCSFWQTPRISWGNAWDLIFFSSAHSLFGFDPRSSCLCNNTQLVLVSLFSLNRINYSKSINNDLLQ